MSDVVDFYIEIIIPCPVQQGTKTWRLLKLPTHPSMVPGWVNEYLPELGAINGPIGL